MVYLEIRRWELNAFTCANKKTDKGTKKFASNKNDTIYALAHTDNTPDEPIKVILKFHKTHTYLIKKLNFSTYFHQEFNYRYEQKYQNAIPLR